MSEHLDFSISLHHRLAPAAEREFCWSPYSVVSALGLLASAASGHTRDELVTVLGVPDGLERLRAMLDSAAQLGKADDGPVLAVANTLWAHEQLPLQESYVRGLAEWPGGTVRNAPFQRDPEAARQEINADVARTTHDLIPELLAPDSIDPNMVAALVNALYLKASWTQSFDQSATATKPFHAPGGRRDVATMHVTRRFGYAHQHGWQAVTLPAAGGVEGVVLLPDRELAEAEATLDGAVLAELLDAGAQQRVALAVPKFESRAASQVERALQELGVRTVFTPAADFSELTTADLHVSTIAHEAVLRVDENGLEGAAATAAMMRMTAIMREPDPIEVTVDRPFLFLVRDRGSGAVYFLARIVDPS